MADETLSCPQEQPEPVGVRGTCGKDRDCLPFVGQEPSFGAAWCNGLAWLAKDPTRGYEIFALDASRPDFRMRQRMITPARTARCGQQFAGAAGVAGSGAGPDPFTIDVPGITDIFRIPGLETAELRRDRARRFRSANPILPAPQRFLTRVLNKLDDAQDLLFTALALSIPILRFGLPRLLPFVGWALTINDALNIFT